jgi:hypothetical protein
MDGRNCLCSWDYVYVFEYVLLAVFGMRSWPEIWDGKNIL